MSLIFHLRLQATLSHRKKYIPYLLLLLLFAGNVLLQIALQQHGLDNQAVNRYSPTATDAVGYVQRAELLAKQGDFTEAFKDGFRPPGYPLFLSVFFHFSIRPLLAARYAQIVLSALTIVFLFFALVNICSSSIEALIGAFIFALWAPLYYFSPMLGAESCSIFLFALFIYLLAKITGKASFLIIYTLPIVLALLVYLKPQHLLLFFPFVLFVLYRVRDFPLKHLLGVSLTLIILIAPWSIFASVMNGKFVPLSTSAGLMLYLGTGVDTDRDLSLAGTVHLKAAKELGLRDEHMTRQLRQDIQGMTDAEKSRFFTRFAVHAWLAKPVRSILYGLSKVLHGYGFSFRGLRDLVLVLFFVSSIIGAIYLWGAKTHREWCVFFWGILLVTSLQMFVFPPEQRYKTVMFDLPALLVVILGILTFFKNRWSRFVSGT